jgi:signal peptidase II
MQLINGFISLTYEKNTGAAFSILSGQRWPLAAIMFVCIIIITAILLRYNEGFWGTLGLAAVLGGAVGNLIDRVVLGHVVDMFSFQFVSFAIFNVADIFITLGGLTFIIFFIISTIKHGRDSEDDAIAASGHSGSSGSSGSSGEDEAYEPEQVNYNDLFYDVTPYPSESAETADVFDGGYNEGYDDVYDSGADSYSAGFNETPGFDDGYDYPESVDEIGSYDEPGAFERRQPIHAGDDVYIIPPPDPPQVAAGDTGPHRHTPVLDALDLLEYELSDPDLVEDYDLDSILKEYGFENNDN